MSWMEQLQRGRALRRKLAERVLGRRQTVKGAAYELGLNVKTVEYHLGRLYLEIREGTDRLMGEGRFTAETRRAQRSER
jgi:hypothetical protein